MDHPPTLDNGRYVLRRPLGKGGTATVFEAWDTRLGEAVAVKLLLGGEEARRGLRRRLVAETQAMRSVHHRNVLRVVDCRAEGDIDYVVMDLAPGGSLQDRLDATGPLPVGEAVGYVEQVLAALAAAHAARVVHRDVKPQNVLLDADGVALLADFGIARVTRSGAEDGLTRMGVAMGSFAYMPPEQRLDAHQVDERADVYAAGATLYALLTAGNPVDLFTAGPESARWAGIPGPLVEVIRKATAQQCADRFSDARGFGQALEAAAATLSSEVMRAPVVVFPGAASGGAGTAEGWRRATREAMTFLRTPTPPAPVSTLVEPGIDSSLPDGEPYRGPAPGRPVVALPEVSGRDSLVPLSPPSRDWRGVLVGGMVAAVVAAVAWAWSGRMVEAPPVEPSPVAVGLEPQPPAAVEPTTPVATEPAVGAPPAPEEPPLAAPSSGPPAIPATGPSAKVPATTSVAPTGSPTTTGSAVATGSSRAPAPGAPASAGAEPQGSPPAAAEAGPFGSWTGTWGEGIIASPVDVTLKRAGEGVVGRVVYPRPDQDPLVHDYVGEYDETKGTLRLRDTSGPEGSPRGLYTLSMRPDGETLDGKFVDDASGVLRTFVLHRAPR